MVSRYKIYIIDEAHMVSKEGFNALLKLVEEPPEFLVFVFATTEPDKVLPTIRSRTHHYPFRLMAPSVLRGLLMRICEEEKATVDGSVFPLVVRAGGGSARDALSIMDQLLAGAGEDGVSYRRAVGLLGVTDGALLDETVDALAAGDAGGVFGAVDRVSEAGHDPRRFTADLLDRLRDLVILDAVPDAADKGMLDLPGDQLTTMADQAARLGTATLSRLADIVHNGLTEMRGTTAPRLLLELVCARMLLPAASDDSSATLQRIERLERRMQIADQSPPPAPTASAVRGRDGESVRRSASRPTPSATSGAERRPTAAAASSAEAPPPPVPAARDAAPKALVVPPASTTSSTAESSSSEPPRPPKQTGDLTVVDLRRLWPDILDAIKERKRTTAALLMSANVLAVEGSVLKLGINSSGLMRRLSEDMNTEIIRAALRDKLGVDWQVQTIVDQVVRAVQFLFLFALAAGVVVLYAALATSRDERIREAGLMRALGASRRQLMSSQILELALSGVLAGTLAALGAIVVGWVLASQVFQFAYQPGWWLLPAGALIGGVFSSATGWWSLRSVVDTPPMATLRGA